MRSRDNSVVILKMLKVSRPGFLESSYTWLDPKRARESLRESSSRR